MRVTFWGVRGSVPVAGPSRFGGNTPCVEVTAEDGTRVILDAGTGIRELGAAGVKVDRAVQILLTHLHLDHIMGLLFFPLFFDPEAEIVVFGPPPEEPDLQRRLARYLSAPLSPIEIREMAARVSFRTVPAEGWWVGPLHIEAAPVLHRGPTLGYCISEDEQSVCYIPDHEPALGGQLDTVDAEWISGHKLAHGTSLLIHDGQFTDEEYPAHLGWGHSSVSDALTFASRASADRVALFHHEPTRDDAGLDALEASARDRWESLEGSAGGVELAREGQTIQLMSGHAT
jgi:phosphoribosyl 1,2-cyclic phosphodiesterase